MRFKSVVVLVVVLMACSLSYAADGHIRGDGMVKNPDLGDVRAGAFGTPTVSITQTGPLQAQVDVSVTTASPGGTNTAANLVVILGQIYDSPWMPPYGTDNTFVSSGTSFFPNSTGLGTFSDSYSFTVNVPNEYMAWAGAWAGESYTGPTYWFWASTQFTSAYTAPLYIDDVQPPTPTPDPNAGGAPIPTLNWLGMLAMVALMLGIAVLVIIRRR